MSKTASAGAGGGGAVYGLGFFGALVYFWKTADGFLDHLWAIGQAFLWPAFVVYDLLQHLGS